MAYTPFLSAGTTFKINSTTIVGMDATPDLGGSVQNVDVTTFDNLTNKAYLAGLKDIQSLNFEFVDGTDNMNAAQALDINASNTYEVKFPDNSKYSWSGSHKTYKLASQPNDKVKFRVECKITSDMTYTPGTGVASAASATPSN